MGGDDTYAMLETGEGSRIHLRAAAGENLDPDHNVCGVYLYAKDVDGLAAQFPGEMICTAGRPEIQPWGTYEFALSDPEGALVRVGWPVGARTQAEAGNEAEVAERGLLCSAMIDHCFGQRCIKGEIAA